MNFKFFIVFLFCLVSVVKCFSASMGEAYVAYEKKDYKRAENVLKNLQAKNPFNAQINYNLGNVYYKQQKFEDATNNFERAFENATGKQGFLKEKAYFNCGNSLYMNALKTLGIDWEKRRCDEKDLDKSAVLVKGAIEKFRKVLEEDSENLEAKNNLQYTEDLLKKIEEKKKQQEEQKQKEQEKQQEDKKQSQDKKNEDEKGKGKGGEKENENPEESEEGQQSENGRQKDNDKQEKGEESKKESKNEESKSDSNDQKSNDLVGKEKKEEESSQKKQREKSSEESGEEEMGEESGSKGVEDQNEKNGEEVEKKSICAAGKEEECKDDKELRGMRAILDRLQSDDAKKQKMLMKHLAKGNPSLNPHQKNW